MVAPHCISTYNTVRHGLPFVKKEICLADIRCAERLKESENNGTVVYLYDGWKICETQDGSDNRKKRCRKEKVSGRISTGLENLPDTFIGH